MPRRFRASFWVPGALSLLLNLTGITWGIPARWHPDEKADVTARMIAEGDLAPDSFVNPSLPLYLMLPPLWLQQRVAQAGLLHGRAADPLLAGRAMAAAAGAAAVLVLGAAVRRSQPALGAWPALFLALFPGFVNLCHFATPEPWILLGTALTLAAALAHRRGRFPVWALGLVLGLTASTKYTAAALAVPAILAVCLRGRATGVDAGNTAHDQRASILAALTGLVLVAAGLALVLGPGDTLAGRLHLADARLLHAEEAVRFVHGLGLAMLGAGAGLFAAWAVARSGRAWAAPFASHALLTLGLAAAAGFLIGTPFALLEPRRFLSDLAFNAQTRHEYKGLVGAGTSYGAYVLLLADGLTVPALVASALGALVALGRALRGQAEPLILLSAAIAPYVLVASSGHQALRFLAPVFPAAAWLAALGLGAFAAPRVRLPAQALVAARAALGALLVIRLFFVDSRLSATRWLEANVPRGAIVDVIANVPNYAPPAPEGRTLRVVPTLSREMAPPERFEEAARRYPAEASEWLVLTAAYYERFLEHPEQRPERASFFRSLLEGKAGFDVVARFRQQGWKRPAAEFLDPEIVVLRKRAVPSGGG